MNAPKDVDYRIALGEGFLAEAEQDFTLEHWRSCVDDAQLASAQRLVRIAQELHGAIEAWRQEQDV